MIPTKAELINLYLDEDYQINEIAELCGCSRQTVYNWFRKYGIERKDYYVWFKCDQCGKSDKVRRKIYENSEHHFCSVPCRLGYTRSPGYRQWKSSQRIAKAIWEKNTECFVKFGEIIGFKDGNNQNVDFKNLMLFKSHSEHMAYHHKLRRE